MKQISSMHTSSSSSQQAMGLKHAAHKKKPLKKKRLVLEPEDDGMLESQRNEGIHIKDPDLNKSPQGSFQRFRDSNHKSKYEARHNNKLLVTRAVKIDTFSPFKEVHAKLVEIFSAMEWISLAAIDTTDVSPSCVKDFYSSMTTSDGCLYVYVGGEERILSKEDWGKFFGLPYRYGPSKISDFNANEVWEEVSGGPNWSKSLALVHDPVDRIILDFCSHSLYCRSQGFSTWEVYDLWCLRYARYMDRVNITEIMFKRMTEVSQDESKNVPYSNLITLFCKEKGWWCRTYQKDLQGVNSQPITPEVLAHMNFVVKNGKLVKKVKKPSPSVPPPQNAPLSGLDSRFESIILKMETMVQSMQSQLTNFENRFSMFQNSVDSKLNALYFAQQQQMFMISMMGGPMGHMFGQMSGQFGRPFGSPWGGQAGHMTGGFMGNSTGGFMSASSSGFMGTNSSTSMGASSSGFVGSGGNQENRFNFQSPFPSTPFFTEANFRNFMNSQPPQQQQRHPDSQHQ